MRCRALMTFNRIEGHTFIQATERCKQDATVGDLCYLHDKYEKGLAEPVDAMGGRIVCVEHPERGILWEGLR